MQDCENRMAFVRGRHQARESRSNSAVKRLEEPEISKAILCTYHERLLDRIVSDVIIVGAGPAGMTAAIRLARAGLKVTLLEKRLSPGGGIWGGGMGMSQTVVQEDALPLLDDLGVKYEPRRKDLYATDAIELAAGLCLRTVQAGVALFNLMTVEDVCLRTRRVTGVVVNRTTIAGALPVDPIAFSAKAIVDAFFRNIGFPYRLNEATHPSFIDGRAGNILVREHNVGVVGEVHPRVLAMWGLETPVTGFEVDLSSLMDLW